MEREIVNTSMILHPSASDRILDAAELYDSETELCLYLCEASGKVCAFWRSINKPERAIAGFWQLQYEPWAWAPQDLYSRLNGSSKLLEASSKLNRCLETLKDKPNCLTTLCEKNEAFVQLWDALDETLARPPVGIDEDSGDIVSDIAEDLITNDLTGAGSAKIRKTDRGILTLSYSKAYVGKPSDAASSSDEMSEVEYDCVSVVSAMFQGAQSARAVDDYYSTDGRKNVELAVRQALEDVGFLVAEEG